MRTCDTCQRRSDEVKCRRIRLIPPGTSGADESRTPSDSASKTAISGISQEKRAESGAVAGDLAPSDPDLAELIDRWPGLPKETRQAILALATGQKEKSLI